MFFILIFKILSLIVLLLLSVAYFTIAERKVMGAFQRRKGPNSIGFIGTLQPFADGLKLFLKETILPTGSNEVVFLLAPGLSFILSLVGWLIIPLSKGLLISDFNLGLLYLLAISALNVYGIVLAGWSSNSKYSYIGSLRSVSQMISYEIPIGFLLLHLIICAKSFNLSAIVLAQYEIWYFIPLLPTLIIFSVSILAETNRHPFDLPEAEAELVSGYNIEYSSMIFALFFLAEYANMLLMSIFLTILFLGGWLIVLNFLNSVCYIFKTTISMIYFVITRATLPRYRYDQLMSIGWKCFLPITIGYLSFLSGGLVCFNCLYN